LEDIVGQIHTPLLNRLNITFFNQLIFDTPLLRDFIGHTETFKTPCRAKIHTTSRDVEVKVFGRDGNNDYDTLTLRISCRPLDWQYSSLSQVFNSALSYLNFEHLEIEGFRHRRQDDMENAQWLEVLHPFTSVKDLVLGGNSIEVVAPALEDLAGERVTEVLPALQNLLVESRQPSEAVKKAIGKFISARRLEGRPVTVKLSTRRKDSDQVYKSWEVGDR